MHISRLNIPDQLMAGKRILFNSSKGLGNCRYLVTHDRKVKNIYDDAVGDKFIDGHRFAPYLRTRPK